MLNRAGFISVTPYAYTGPYTQKYPHLVWFSTSMSNINCIQIIRTGEKLRYYKRNEEKETDRQADITTRTEME